MTWTGSSIASLLVDEHVQGGLPDRLPDDHELRRLSRGRNGGDARVVHRLGHGGRAVRRHPEAEHDADGQRTEPGRHRPRRPGGGLPDGLERDSGRGRTPREEGHRDRKQSEDPHVSRPPSRPHRRLRPRPRPRPRPTACARARIRVRVAALRHVKRDLRLRSRTRRRERCVPDRQRGELGHAPRLALRRQHLRIRRRERASDSAPQNGAVGAHGRRGHAGLGPDGQRRRGQVGLEPDRGDRLPVDVSEVDHVAP